MLIQESLVNFKIEIMQNMFSENNGNKVGIMMKTLYTQNGGMYQKYCLEENVLL
jgi:hypothetical protein